jgi:hypothetical protein
MRRLPRVSCAVAALALAAGLSGTPASAQVVVVDNGPFSTDTSLGGTAPGMSSDSIADDFSLAGATSLTAVRFWASDNAAPFDTLEAFSGTLSYFIRADDGGVPGAALHSGTVSGAQVTRTDTGVDLVLTDSYRIFQLDFSIPEVTLSAGTYWLQLREGTLSSAFDGTEVH